MKSKLLRNSYVAIPLYFIAIVPFVCLARRLELDFNFGYIALGAIGWWLALIIRLPFIFLLQKVFVDQKTLSKYVVGLSGPAEEIVRLIILLIIGITSGNAYMVGIGWAFIEIIYGLVQLFGFAILDGKNDKKSKEAKEMIKRMGMDKTFDASTPFWGALERVSASAIHISFGLLLVYSPWFVLVTIPLHSGVNFMVLFLNKKSIGFSQLVFFILSFVALTLLTLNID